MFWRCAAQVESWSLLVVVLLAVAPASGLQHQFLHQELPGGLSVRPPLPQAATVPPSAPPADTGSFPVFGPSDEEEDVNGEREEDEAAPSPAIANGTRQGDQPQPTPMWQQVLAQSGPIRPPLIMVATGCTGSTIVLRVAKAILRNHSVRSLQARNELTKREKNPFYMKVVRDNVTEVRGKMAHAMVLAAKAATEQNRTLIFKATVNFFEDRVLNQAMQALKAKVVVMARGNIIDWTTCLARDCFKSGLFNQDVGYPVLENGTRTDICYHRRLQNISTKAYFNTTNLISVLKEKLQSENETMRRLRAVGYSDLQPVYFERLMAFEVNSSRTSKSAFAWGRFFDSLNLDFNRESINEFLLSRAGTYPQPLAHAATIYNLESVVDVMKDHPELLTFLRHTPGLSVGGQEEAGSECDGTASAECQGGEDAADLRQGASDEGGEEDEEEEPDDETLEKEDEEEETDEVSSEKEEKKQTNAERDVEKALDGDAVEEEDDSAEQELERAERELNSKLEKAEREAEKEERKEESEAFAERAEDKDLAKALDQRRRRRHPHKAGAVRSAAVEDAGSRRRRRKSSGTDV